MEDEVYQSPSPLYKYSNSELMNEIYQRGLIKDFNVEARYPDYAISNMAEFEAFALKELLNELGHGVMRLAQDFQGTSITTTHDVVKQEIVYKGSIFFTKHPNVVRGV